MRRTGDAAQGTDNQACLLGSKLGKLPLVSAQGHTRGSQPRLCWRSLPPLARQVAPHLEVGGEGLAGAAGVQDGDRHAAGGNKREGHGHAVVVVRLDLDAGLDLPRSGHGWGRVGGPGGRGEAEGPVHVYGRVAREDDAGPLTLRVLLRAWGVHGRSAAGMLAPALPRWGRAPPWAG